MKIIKATTLLTLQLIVTINLLNAQTLEFSLNGKINSIENSSNENMQEFISSRSQVLTDSTQLVTTGLGSNTFRRNFQTELGFEFGIGLDISLNDRLSIATGLGFTYSELEIQTEFIDFQFDPITFDTIPYSPPISSGGLFGCTRTINTISDLPEIDNKPVVRFVDLSIPIGIQYKIIPGKLDLQVGGLLQTPIYADAPREFYDIERTPTTDGIECEWVVEEFQDDFQKRFTFARVSLQSVVRYHFLKNVSAEVGIRKMLNNAYQEENFGGTTIEFRPLSYTFGFSYILGQKKMNNDI
ncbi:MAG: hypothetical protein AAFQ94_10585 [Bacteroidota bacterium]